MKKTIARLSLFACIVVPITSLLADSNSTVLAQDQIPGVGLDTNSSTFQLNKQFIDLAKTIIENKVVTGMDVKNFDEAFNIHYKAFSKTINNSKATVSQIKSATNGLRGMYAVKLFVKGVSTAGTALSVLDYKDAADSFFSEAATGRISPEASSNLLEKAISFHPVGAGLASIKNSTLDSMRVLNDINSTFTSTIRNEATMFSNEVSSFTENAIVDDNIDILIYEETKTKHIIRLVQIKNDIAQTPMWPGDRKKLGESIDKLIEAMGSVNYQDRFDNIYIVQNDLINNSIESHTLVNSDTKPTQAELDAKAKEQLIIASKIAESNKSLSSLKSQFESKNAELKKLEAQADSVNETEFQQTKILNTFYFQALIINKRYKGNIKNISPQDMKKLLMLAKNTLGSGREWRYLFTNSPSLFREIHKKYMDMQKQRTASTKNITRIALLRESISRLEHDIIQKQRENTEYQTEKHDIDFITMNLIDAANDDNKVILAVEQGSNSNSYWTGNSTAVYYEDNNGIPHFGPYGDGEAETKEIKPGNGSTIYLVDGETRILSESEASYFGSYAYTAWGTWSAPAPLDGSGTYTSHWVVTDQTLVIDMPKQGTASYTGELAGGQFTIGQSAGYNAVNGNINLNADFSSKTITGNLTVKNASTGATWGTASISNGSIENSEFDGQLVGAGISNAADWHSQIRGSFGGNSAAEAGGMWAITKGTGASGDERAVGVFRAKKQ